MMLSLPVYEAPPHPKPVQSVTIDVRYVVFHRNGLQMKIFDSWFDRSGKTWCNIHNTATNGNGVYVPVDPLTAMSVFGLTAKDMGFSEAEQALLNLIKR